VDSLTTGKPLCHHIPDVEKRISVALNFELVVQPLFAVGAFGDLQCDCCLFSGSYVTMFDYKHSKHTQYVLSALEMTGLISIRNYCSSNVFFRIIYAQTFLMFK
jgi:hypothetical protein